MERHRFGTVRQLPSGNYQASFVPPSGGRINVPFTFDSAADAELWLATQRADLVRRAGRPRDREAATRGLRDRLA